MMNNPEKQQKEKWKTDPEQLEKTVQQVKLKKMSVQKASLHFGIAKTTISDHITGK